MKILVGITTYLHQHFPTWLPSAIMYWNFVILHHPRSQLCGSISLSKFGDDPILAVGDIAIYDFASLAKNA